MITKCCEKCGAKYEITEQSYPMRDKDTIECDFCGTAIHSWNGGVICSAKLIYESTINKHENNINAKPNA